MRPDHFTDYEQPEPEAFRLLCRACPPSAKWIEDRTGRPSGFVELSSRDAPFEAIPGKKEAAISPPWPPATHRSSTSLLDWTNCSPSSSIELLIGKGAPGKV